MNDLLEPVVCPAILLCERIIREAGTGKHSLINIFSNINAPRFPLMTMPCFLYVALTNLKGQHTELHIATRFENPKSGQVYFATGGKVKLKEGVALTGSEVLEMPIPIRPFQLFEPGNYSIVVLVNNEPVGKRALNVISFTENQSKIESAG